ncbi:uncharacterized protein LOC103867765 isoform X2 [Brassica rapa]|uniref:uncharacterized protein LOC103867765 isoform X2 n=1 Tax=Brassica campestris TaxID=3711 RepID=UPI00142D3368|nr:uncharacterized protein LOC103867765 isoform X2 [Brassica rapa]
MTLFVILISHMYDIDFICTGRVARVDMDKGWCYAACSKCSKTAAHCLRYCVCAMRQCSCCRDFPVRLHYRVETAIADGTAEGAFFCFDGVVTKLHSLRESEAGQMLAEGVNPEDFKMPPFTTHIEAKTVCQSITFQFSVSTYNFTAIIHSPSRSFSMNVTVCQSLALSTT